MKVYVRSSSVADNLGLGPRQKKEFVRLVTAYNSLPIRTQALYTSKTLGQCLDYYFRQCGLVYGDDFICPAFHEDCICKLSDVTVPVPEF